MKKTKKILVTLLLISIFYMNNVYAGCKLGPNVIRDLAGLYTVLKIMVPSIIIALTVWEVFNTVLKGDAEAEIKKVAIKFLKRIAIAILILFTPMLVNQVMSILSLDTDADGNSSCFKYLMDPSLMGDEEKEGEEVQYNELSMNDLITVGGETYIITDIQGKYTDAEGVTYYAVPQHNFYGIEDYAFTWDTDYEFMNGDCSRSDCYMTGSDGKVLSNQAIGTKKYGRIFDDSYSTDSIDFKKIELGSLDSKTLTRVVVRVNNATDRTTCESGITKYAEYLKNYEGINVIMPSSEHIKTNAISKVKGGVFFLAETNTGFVTSQVVSDWKKNIGNNLKEAKERGENANLLTNILDGAGNIINESVLVDSYPPGDVLNVTTVGAQTKKIFGIDTGKGNVSPHWGCRPMIKFTEAAYKKLAK